MFITFEGIEGSGKTTQIKRLRKTLQERGISCLITREPGATKIGLQIRAILLDQKNKKMDPRAELFLYSGRPMPACSTKKFSRPWPKIRWVISDRFWDATVVYQGLARGLNGKFLKGLRPFILGSLWPDKTFLLDCRSPSAWPAPGNGSTARKNRRKSPALRKRPCPFMRKSAGAIFLWPAKSGGA